MSYPVPSKKIASTVAFCCGLASSTALFAAAVHDPASQPTWDIAPFGLKSTDLYAGPTKAYRPWFENGAWQGDVIEYDIAVDGTRSLGSWSARAAFEAQEATTADYWKAGIGRKIITYDGSSQIAFRWDALTATQAEALDPITAADAGATDPYSSPVLNYIRGDRLLEIPDGTYRKRYSLLGDIIHSQPQHVGAPDGNSVLPGYAAFKNANSNRPGRVYVGANDGMLHVFDATNGNEVYAYVPSMLIGKLRSLTKASYTHTFFVDGQMDVADALVGSTWKTILASGLGAGAKGLFALDITSADLASESSTTGSDRKIIWEKTDSALGHVHGRPRIARLPDGKAYVVSGNGYGSDDNVARLYLAPLDGSSVTTIATDAMTGNGLSAPTLLDIDYDGVADHAYAGDLFGRLWRFNLTTGSAFKLFDAGADKPITTAPDVSLHPYGGHLIYFGTGSLLSSADAGDTSVQSIYAIWDKPGNSSAVLANSLVEQTLTAASHPAGAAVRVATDNLVNWSTHYGWTTNLPGTGERLIGNPQLRGKRLQLVTDQPDRTSWLLGLDWLTGGDPKVIQFDLNNDHFLGIGDTVAVDDVDRYPVGLNLGIGNMSQPAIGRISNGIDIHYINGLVVPALDPCEGACEGGIARGHIDVDMDTVLGDSTDWHKHEYDDAYNVTHVDYFDLFGGTPIDEVGIDAGANLIVIMANADLSPGAKFTLGDKEWNVVDYQEMVQRKLQAWDGTSALLDDDGEPLVFTLSQITAGGGTLRTSFNAQSIATGGVIPSVTGCVKGNDNYDTTGRWRNGALTMHVLNVDVLKASGNPQTLWHAQTPVDLAEGMSGGGLIANPVDDSAFRYESTVFWHWGGDFAKAVLGYGGMCYGEPGWAEASAVEIAGINADVLENLFPGYAENQDLIDGLLSQLDNYSCENGTGAQCAKESGYIAIFEQLEDVLPGAKDLVDFRNKYKDYTGNSPSGGGTSGSGAPTDVTDRVQDLNPILGPVIRVGRRAWIDP